MFKSNPIPDVIGSKVDSGIGILSKSFIKTATTIGDSDEATQSKNSCIPDTRRVLSNHNTSGGSGTKSFDIVNSRKNKSDVKNVFGIQKRPNTVAARHCKNQQTTKYPKRLNLSSRSDVLNKASIRKLRRHFWTLFRNNSSIGTFRADRLSFAKVLKAMKTLLAKTYDKEIFDDDMCMFIIGITKLTQIKNLDIDLRIKYSVYEFLEC